MRPLLEQLETLSTPPTSTITPTLVREIRREDIDQRRRQDNLVIKGTTQSENDIQTVVDLASAIGVQTDNGAITECRRVGAKKQLLIVQFASKDLT